MGGFALVNFFDILRCMIGKYKLAFILSVAVLIIGGFYFLDKRGDGVSDSILLPNATTSTPLIVSTSTNSGNANVSATGDFTIEEVPFEASIAYPALDRPYTLPPSITGEAATLMRERIALAISTLKKNPADVGAWLQLAIYRKQVHDYEGARDIWEFLVLNGGGNAVVYGNLGNLYHFYLKDYPKSEKSYQEAIKIDPKAPGLYRGLYELYRYSYKTGTNLWEKTLKNGIEKLPDTVDLQVLLAFRYGELGRKVEAISAYNGAIETAGRIGNEQLAEQIRRDRDALK